MREWWDNSPLISRREVFAVAIGAALIAIGQFLPLILHLGVVIPLDLGDPLSQSWQVAWGGHALLTQPLQFWQSNQFWPLQDSLAFSDALVGYAPTGMIGSGPFDAVVRYDLLFLFAFALALFGAYLLAREIGVPPWAALVAGAAFAYSPWRLEQGGHMHVISSGGIPLAIFLLLRGYRRGSTRLIVGGWLVAAWQCSLGFALGLQLDYLLILLGLIGFVAWWRSGRPKPPTRVIWTTVGGALFLAISSAVLALPYLRVLDAHPEAARSIDVLYRFSPSPLAFLNAPESNLIWGDLSHTFRLRWHANAEKTLFPGLIISLLALVGLIWGRWPRALRIGLAISIPTLMLLSLGVHSHGLGRYLPYRFVYELLPGWQGIRTPGRLQTLTTLALALLAGAGAASLATALAKRLGRIPASVVGLLIAGLVLIEGSGFIYPHPVVPVAPSGLAGLQAPLLQLPFNATANRRYLVWSTDGFPKMVNGRTSFEPTRAAEIVKRATGFPDQASISYLRSIGLKTVVIHTEFLPDLTRAKAQRDFKKQWSGVTSQQRGPLLIYGIAPAR